MIKRLLTFVLNQPLFLILITGLFIAIGISAFKALPVEAFPDVSDVQVNVITLFPGHAAEEVEKQITIPIETELSGLPHSVRMFSHTQFGLSFIVVTFDDKANDYFARQQVLERLQNAELPQGVQPSLAPLSTPIGEVYRYRILSENQQVSSTELRTLQDWVVTRNLKMIPGVADVVSLGGYIKQYQVSIDLGKMKTHNVTLQQLLTALGRSNANAGGSFLDQGEQQYIIRGIGLLSSPDDINNVVIAEHKGIPLLLKDIASVTISGIPRQGMIGQDDDDDIVTGIVLMRKGENSADVLRDVKAKIDKLNQSVLPKGVMIKSYYDRTWLLDSTLHTVFENLFEGAVLVALILFLFLGEFKPAAIVASLIPLALLSTFIGLRLRGIPANLLSLGAMDFGIIVDGAVIVVENIFRKLSMKKQGSLEEFKTTIIEATDEVGRPTLFSMLIIIIAHIPIFTLQRQEGRIFAPMAYTVTSALIGSLVFSITLVPLLCYFLLRNGVNEKENRIVHASKHIYKHWLAIALKNKKKVVGTAIGLLLASLLCLPLIGSEFLPELNEGSIWMNVVMPPGISLNEAARISKFIRQSIDKFPEVNSVISKFGRPEDGSDPKPVNNGEFLLDLKPQDQWKRHISKEKLIDDIYKSLNVIPGLDIGFSQPIRDNVLESISQIKGQIVIKLFGQDAAILHQKADEVLKAVSSIRGVAQAFIDKAGDVPQLQIRIDRKRAARYGLNVQDVEDVIETALAGKVVTDIWEGEKRFGVVVRLPEEQRHDVEAIKKILVDTPAGARIPLAEVADIAVENGSMNISRESGMRVSAIGVFIKGRDMGSVVKDMQSKVEKDVVLPKGITATWGGEFENQKRAMGQLMVIVPVSILLIFVLLFSVFQSAKNAFLILANVPFALIGGIFALLISRIPLSVSAAIGFIALFGQAVLNGVVMVSCFNQLRAEGKSPAQSVSEGAEIRLRTVLMTALLAILGLTPMALSHGIGSEVQKPLAIVIIGGLFSATFLTLFVLPIIYLALEERGLKLPLKRKGHAAGTRHNALK